MDGCALYSVVRAIAEKVRLLGVGIALVVGLLAAGAPAAQAQTHTVTVEPELVCQLADGADSSGGCGDVETQVGELCIDACQWYRVLAKFDIAGELPANAVIQSASLGTTTSTGTGVSTRRLLASWTAAATWYTRDGVNAWPGNPGALDASTGPLADDVTALVKGWFTGSQTNHGLLYLAELESWGGWIPIMPDLSVTYTLDTTPPTVALSGALKDAEGQPLEQAAYDLDIATSDAGSGVASIKVRVDGVLKAEITPTTGTFEFKTDRYADGARVVTVQVTDNAGNTAASTVAAHNAQLEACLVWAREETDYCAETDRDQDDQIQDAAGLGPDGAEPEYDPTAAACIAIYTDPALCDPANNPPDPDEGGVFSLLATPAYGIADEHWQSLTLPAFTALAPKYVKKIVPYDVVDNYHLTGNPERPKVYDEWKAFYNQAMAQNIQVLVAFERTHRADRTTNRNESPTIARYEQKVLQFLDENRRITRVAAWNEPNNAGQPTRSHRKAGTGYAAGFGAPGAARYTHALARLCKISTSNPSPRCLMVLGEFAIDPDGKWKSYVQRFKSELAERRSLAPFAYWGIHPYGDIYRRRNVNNSSVAAYDAYVPSGDQVWITEAGSRTDLYRDELPDEDKVEDRQVLELRYLYDDLGALPQVKRIYHYHMCEPEPDSGPNSPRWDSGLLGRDCVHVRKGWQVVKNRMNP